MFKILLSLLLALSLCSIASAEPEAGTLRFNFEKRRSTTGLGSTSELSKRQSSPVLAQITNEQLLYLINITVGTPGQPLSLQLDTGSSDTWFPAYTSNICEAGDEYCTLGSFNYNQSSTFNVLESDGTFSIEYVDGSAIQGVYITEAVNIGNAKLTNATLALALRADRDVGIMGVGFEADETGNARKNDPFTYPNIVGALKAEGHISTLSYSLWLDDLDADIGSVLFGGIDHTKYTGPLVSLPIQNDIQTGQKTSFTVTWSNLTMTNNAQSIVLTPSSPQPAILDSGTTLTYLPQNVANSIFNALGVTTDPEVGEILPCKVAANNITFTFTFGGPGGAVISIPVSELLIPLTNDDGSPYTGTRSGQGDALCVFGIEAASAEDPILFGDTFLRSAYVVYDLENLQVGLAQLNLQASAAATASDQPIASTNSIPGVASTASAVTVDQTFTGNPLITAGTARSSSGADSTVSRSATLQLTASGTSAFTATAQAQSQGQTQTRASSGSTSGSGSSTGSARTSGFTVTSNSGSQTSASASSASSPVASGSASSATAAAGADGGRVELVKGLNVFGLGLCAVAVLGGFAAVVL